MYTLNEISKNVTQLLLFTRSQQLPCTGYIRVRARRRAACVNLFQILLYVRHNKMSEVEEERSLCRDLANMNVAPLQEALGVDILDKNAQRSGVIVSISSQIGHVCLFNASVAPDKQHGVKLCFSSAIFQASTGLK